jgi:hypothetical protein
MIPKRPVGHFRPLQYIHPPPPRSFVQYIKSGVLIIDRVFITLFKVVSIYDLSS